MNMQEGNLNEIITTFDGIKHNKVEIVEKMIDDDFYYGYLGKNALSASSIKTILNSPKQYLKNMYEGQKESQPLRDGKLFHWKILEPEKFDSLNVVNVASKNTKTYKEAVAIHGEVYTQSEIDNCKILVEAINNNTFCRDLINQGEYEIPNIMMIDGIPIRGKADCIVGDTIIDLKTTNDILNFRYSAKKYSYDLQAYLYITMFENINNFRFICIDKKTLELGVFDCSPEFLDSGRRKFERGIELYKKLFKSGEDINENLLIKEMLN
jgi:hypothetical protein